jgi:hypothetical protein
MEGELKKRDKRKRLRKKRESKSQGLISDSVARDASQQGDPAADRRKMTGSGQ